MDKGFVNTTNSWYALAAIREGKWSPYLMISKLQSEGPFEDPQSSAIANGSFGPALAPFGNVISRVIALRNQSQTTTSIGVRYDLMKNVALKVQYDHVQPNNSYGMYAYPSSQLRPAGTANIASVNLDFIF
jgi:predicted porin